MKIKIAGFYMDKFYALDNFSAFQVLLLGIPFMTAEHAYQWSKFLLADDENARLSPEERSRHHNAQTEVVNAKSAHDAKRLAATHKDLRSPTWEKDKLVQMENVLRAKFEQHEYVRETLRRTEGLPIVETSPVDSFWGWGPNKDGQNQLGRLWMKIRFERLGLPAVDCVPDAAVDPSA